MVLQDPEELRRGARNCFKLALPPLKLSCQILYPMFLIMVTFEYPDTRVGWLVGRFCSESDGALLGTGAEARETPVGVMVVVSCGGRAGERVVGENGDG